AFTPDGSALVIGGHNRPVQEYNLASGNEQMTIADKLGNSPLVAVSPDGKALAIGDGGGSVWIWGARTGIRRAQAARGSKTIYALAFGPDGTTLAVGGRTEKGGGLLQLLDLDSDKV